MVTQTDDKARTFTLNALRIVVGLAFFSHGAQKLFGWFGGFGPEGGSAELMSRFGAAGVIETVCGAMIVLGLFTRAAAFLASGEMAVAYFWMHVGGTGALFWWANGGELVMIFSFTWLFFAAHGGGSFSLDAWMEQRRAAGNGGGSPEAGVGAARTGAEGTTRAGAPGTSPPGAPGAPRPGEGGTPEGPQAGSA